MNLGLTAYLTIALLLALLGGWFMYDRWQTADERADKAEHALTQVKTNDKIVTQVVTEIVKVPGPTVVRERLVRVCDAASVPGAGLPNAAAGTDPVDRRTDLAGDIGAAKRNQLRCAALIEVLRPQIE